MLKVTQDWLAQHLGFEQAIIHIQIITMKFTWSDSLDLGDGTVSYDPDLLIRLEPIPEVKQK